MAEINKWAITASGNNAQAAPDNWKEGQSRTSVNDTGRETHAALRRWYNDAEWIQLHDSPLGANVVTRESTSSVRVAAAPNAPATADYPVGCRVRISHASGATLEANCTSSSLSGSDLIVQVDSTAIAADANSIRRYLSKTARSAAFSATGIGAGKIPLWDNLGTAAFKNEGPGSGLNADLLDGQHGSFYTDLFTDTNSRPNLLLNGAMRIWQRGTTIDNTLQFQAVDGGYTADGWKHLNEGAAATIVRFDQDTDAPVGFGNSMKITALAPAAGPNSEKFGLCQILERADTIQALGGTGRVSLGFYAKTNVGSTLTRMKAAVIVWNGAADVPTADPIAGWQPEGSDPTLAAGAWAYEGVTGLLTLTSSWQQFKLDNVLIDTANVANLAVLIWVDDKSYVGGGTPDIVWITGVKLELSSAVGAYVQPSMGEELARAQRYFWKTFDYGTRPQQNAGLAGALIAATAGWRFGTQMLKTPTIVRYNTSAANTNWSDGGASASVNPGTHGVTITTGGAAGANLHATAEAVL